MKKNPAAILTIILALWGTTAFPGEMSLESYISNMEILEKNQGE